MTRSLRGQLGLAMALAGFVLTLGAVVLVGFERWQEDQSSLPAAVEFQAFRLSEAAQETIIEPDIAAGSNRFALLLDDQAEVISSKGAVNDRTLDTARSLWADTSRQDQVISVGEILDDGTEVFVSAIACVDPDVCHSAIVGGTSVGLADYLIARAHWLFGPALAVGALALLAARWMVARSLRPVEAIRAEMAVITATELDRRVPVPNTGDELQQLAVTMNDTLSNLQVSRSATERFAADAAHELRSPLTGVRAAVELRAANDELLSEALTELDRAGRLIDDLLVLARTQASGPAVIEVDLDDIVRSDIAAASASYPDVRFEANLEPARINGDPDALRRIVTNLTENAANYCTTKVSVRLTWTEDRVDLLVDDDGSGVPIQERHRVFERFARLDTSRSRETGGSGLGLALVAELVAGHGGHVRIDDSPLGGARFTASFPATPN